MKPADLYRLAESVKAGETTTVMLFPIGNWTSNDPRYPKLPLTRELADELVANFDAGVLGTDVQFSVAGTHNVAAAAGFWVRGLHIGPYSWQGHEGDALWADADWTEPGAEAVNTGAFRYVSIEAGELKTNTGQTYDWVLQGGVLTNKPVMKIMPPVLDATKAIAAAERTPLAEIALSEIALAAADDPAASLIDEIDGLLAKLSEQLKGKTGIAAIRTMMREVKAKASAHTLAEDSYNDLRAELEQALGDLVGSACWAEDFGDDWAVYSVSSPMDSPTRTYRVSYVRDASGITFGQPVEVKRETSYIPVSPSLSEPSPTGGASGEQLADGASHAGVDGQSTQGKEKKRMSELTELLKLSEGSDDALILAEVRKVAKERDDAVTKLAENEHKTVVGAVTLKLDEAIKEGRIAPSERDGYLGLAEVDAQRATEMIDGRKSKVIDLAERGKSQKPDLPEDTGKNASVELAEKIEARKAKDGVDHTTARRLVLSEDPDLAERYLAFREGKEG
jgi:hypothetical protein